MDLGDDSNVIPTTMHARLMFDVCLSNAYAAIHSSFILRHAMCEESLVSPANAVHMRKRVGVAVAVRSCMRAIVH